MSSSDLLLDLDELNVRHELSSNNRSRLFDDILRQCHNKIRKHNNQFKRQECFFAPPPFAIGKPPYNYIDLVNYLMASLRKNGLKVEWIPQKNVLYLSWKPVDVNLDQYHSHFSQTVYQDDIRFLKINNANQSDTIVGKKRKKNEKPIIQHVAMVEYDNNAKDIIPINIKAL